MVDIEGNIIPFTVFSSSACSMYILERIDLLCWRSVCCRNTPPLVKEDLDHDDQRSLQRSAESSIDYSDRERFRDTPGTGLLGS